MPAEILAIGTTLANSDDVVVAVGIPLTVCLKDAAGPLVDAYSKVLILLKDNSGEYFMVDELSGGRPGLVIIGAGTYRFSRPAGASCGVFSG